MIQSCQAQSIEKALRIGNIDLAKKDHEKHIQWVKKD